MVDGRFVFLPWVQVPKHVRIGGLNFVPTDTEKLGEFLPKKLIGPAAMAVKSHVDWNGQPIKEFTVLLRTKTKENWNIPDREWPTVFQKSELLALSCLSEQEFLGGHFYPHLNSAMFHPVNMRIESGSEAVSLIIRGRGRSLRIGGHNTSEIRFQKPIQTRGTKCTKVNEELAAALWSERRRKSNLWFRIEAALEVFLLANAEDPHLDDSTCLMLQAIAFERLMEPHNRNSFGFSEAFDEIWKSKQPIQLSGSKSVKPDQDLRHANLQANWSVSQKWAKELYEARSAVAHSGPKSNLSKNWESWQHMVAAPFAFCLVVKKLLERSGGFNLSELDQVKIDVFDKLLTSDWGRGWSKPPQWQDIISSELASRQLLESITTALAHP